MSNFRPMLAGVAPEDLSQISYPVLLSPKIDGVRCVIHEGAAVSRTLKPIPCEYVRRELAGIPDGVDGELLVSVGGRRGTFSECQSAFMSQEGEPDFTFCAFDWFHGERAAGAYRTWPTSYLTRLANLVQWSEEQGNVRLSVLEQVWCAGEDQVRALEERWVGEGWEGAMIRCPNGPYKLGRSTLREGYLLKLKRFQDAEAVVVGVEELMHNDNAQERNALGLAKRSHAQAGQRPGGTLGALVCVTPEGVEFRIGSGFTDGQRSEMWTARKSAVLGSTVKYKHQPTPGHEAPRSPVFLGFRHD